jgi:hypothetical protein
MDSEMGRQRFLESCLIPCEWGCTNHDMTSHSILGAPVPAQLSGHQQSLTKTAGLQPVLPAGLTANLCRLCHPHRNSLMGPQSSLSLN